MNGININQTDAESENIPDDLNSLAYGEYEIPNISRRRISAYILSVISILIGLAYVLLDLKFLNYPLLIVSGITLYLYFINYRINIKQSEIIELSAKHIEHSVGYYSVALTFKGLLLSPIWTAIIYDHNKPPKQRSIVELSGTTGKLVEKVYTEYI